MKAITFDRMVVKMMKAASKFLFELSVLELLKKMGMKYLKDEEESFKYFPFALYATEVTLKQANRTTSVRNISYMGIKRKCPYYPMAHLYAV